jgi:DNA replication and repair protein RecF
VTIQRIEVAGYRNLADAAILLPDGLSVFWGDNGQGKTNVLEAVYLLATLKSFRGARNRDLIRHGAGAASITGAVVDRGLRRHCRVAIEPVGRRCQLDGKDPRALTDYFSAVRAVAFVPQDLRLVDGPPELRRGFLDRTAFTLDPIFLDTAREYQAALSQKNALLRASRAAGTAPDPNLLDAWDQRLAEAGARVVARRLGLLRDFAPRFREIHDGIAGAAPGHAELRYRCCAGADASAESLPELVAALSRRIADARRDEVARGFALLGPHREDWDLQVGGQALRRFGSQGQLRSAALALRVTQLLLASQRAASPPIFLLDDVSSELDPQRNQRLFGLLRSLNTQVAITTTDLLNLRLPSSAYSAFHVESGRIDA